MIPTSFIVSRLAAFVFVFPLSILFFVWTLKKGVFLLQGLPTPTPTEFENYLLASPLLLAIVYFSLVLQAVHFLFLRARRPSPLLLRPMVWGDMLRILGGIAGFIFFIYWASFFLWPTVSLRLPVEIVNFLHLLGLIATSIYLSLGLWRFMVRYGFVQGPKARRRWAFVCLLYFLCCTGVHSYDLFLQDLIPPFDLQKLIQSIIP